MRNRLLSLCRAIAGLAWLAPVAAAAATYPAGFAETLVASGLTSPTAMQFAADGRIFVTEKSGRIRVIRDGELQAAPFATIAVDDEAERGLLGIALDPGFPSTPYVYVYYTVRATATAAVHNRVSRFTANGDVAAPGSELVLVDLDDLTTTLHNAGDLDFGPDGKLYVAVGDNALGYTAQSLSSRLGKLLRLNADGTIPTDNPFYATASGPNRAIYAYGLRNPFKIAVNRGGGTPAILINDVGGSQYEEINDAIPGANYGYPSIEGYSTHGDYTSPRYAYDHSPSGGCAILGGAFYAPGSGGYPAAFANTYLFADYCNGWIRRLDLASGNTVSEFATGLAAPVDLQVVDGFLYYLSIEQGAVYRVEYGTTAPLIAAHPQNVVVSPGQAAAFSVTATGTALQYQWQRDGVDIGGATGRTYTIASPQLADTGSRFRVVVSNASGNVVSREATLVVTLDQPPTPAILLPVPGAIYEGGQTIAFSGSAVDAEDGVLGPAAFTWRVDFHHDTHIHPFVPPTTGVTSGTFVIPTTGETSPHVWYTLVLTVTDSIGRASTIEREIQPHIVRLTLTTSPPGLQLRLDGQLVTTPYSFDNVVGVSRLIDAPDQARDGVSYAFASWSDGGAKGRTVPAPAVPTTFEAWFRTVAASAPPSPPTDVTLTANGRTLHASWSRVPGAVGYRVEAGSQSGASDRLVVDVGDVESVEGLVPPGAYYVRVRALNGLGVSAPSAEAALVVSSSADCDTPPPVPTGYVAQGGGLLVSLAWATSPGATGYRLEAGSGPGLANLASMDLGPVTTFNTTAPPGTYYTRVRAYNGCGVSAPATEVPVTLACSATAVVPGGLEVRKAAGTATFTWLPPLGATSYHMQVGTAPDRSDLGDIAIGPATTLPVNLAGIAPGTYYVRVTAVSACGVGAPSNEVAVTVP